MLNNISITAKTEISGDTLIRLAEIQAEIQKSNTAALVGLANNGIQLLILAQQARVAEAEAQKARFEAEKAKYAAEAATADAEFRKASVKATKKPYTNGVAYNAE